VEIFTPQVALGGDNGGWECYVFNISPITLHGTVEFVNASDPILGNTLQAWTLPPRGVAVLERQAPDVEVFHTQACHVTSGDAKKGDRLITLCGFSAGRTCQSTVTAQ
jgi:hypothetical protein